MTARLVKAAPVPVPGKGRGLRATETIEAGELIDSAPTILLSARDCDRLEGTAVGDFYFAHPENDDDGLVVLGLPSLCNHAEEANAEVRWRHEEAVGWIADLVARRAIRAGDEITYSYRCGPWFQVAE